MAGHALKAFFVGIPLGVVFVDCVGYIARVDGGSMQPALNPDRDYGDYVFLSKWPTRDLKVERGDVISLKSPKNPKQVLIKRVVGLQGDIIKTKGYKKPYVKVPPGHCWIEGDNTGHSYDSNNFGPISLGLMTAQATHVVWPPSRWQSIAVASRTYRPKTPILSKCDIE